MTSAAAWRRCSLNQRDCHKMSTVDAMGSALGVVPHTRDTFELTDGRLAERDIGRTWIRIGDLAEMTLIVFDDTSSRALLGAYTLEGLRLAADPTAQRLVRVRGLLLADVVSR